VCINTAGGYTCSCTEGYWLVGGQCQDIDECRYGYCQQLCANHNCVNTPGSFQCHCPGGYYIYEDGRSCEDINECETGNNTCRTAQVCFNFQGGYTCLDPLKCDPPYVELSDNQCMCSAENPACRDRPFTILYRHMDLSSGPRCSPSRHIPDAGHHSDPPELFLYLPDSKGPGNDWDESFYMEG
ncbi:unnamed protein product, partial [Coregonus sp. 'balchen']